MKRVPIFRRVFSCGAALLMLCGAILPLVGCNKPAIKEGALVEVYETAGTKSKLFQRMDDLKTVPYDEYSMNISVNVDSKKELQAFHGCGASLTHSSAYLLMQQSAADRKETLELLFGEKGARLSCIRIPIGSCDYTPTSAHFTCDDLTSTGSSTDPEFLQFSLFNDTDILAVMEEIYQINPDILVMATPWSAPAWMKTNNSLIGGTLKEDYEELYAEYLYKFVEKYERKGVKIQYIGVCNEPRVERVAYPSMNLGTDQHTKIVNALGKLLEENERSDVKIIFYDDNYKNEDDLVAQLLIDSVLGSDAAKYVSGVAFHAYAGNYEDTTTYGISYMNQYYPDAEMYMTEVTEHSGVVDFAANLSFCMEDILLNPINAGTSMALYWNFVLNSQGKPVLGNSATCYGLLTVEENSDGSSYIAKNAAFYGLSHVSHFCYPVDGKECVVLETESSNETKIIATGFKRADGATIVVVENSNDATYEDVDVVVDGMCVTYRLLPQSAVTFLFSPNAGTEEYASHEISEMNFTITGKDAYDVTLKTDFVETPDFYMTDADPLDYDTATVIPAKKDGDYYTFSLSPAQIKTLTRRSKDLFLWAVSKGEYAVFPLTLPSIDPFVQINEEGNAVVYFGLNTKTSWSSYCDPAGKSVWRSANSVFDDSAECIAQDLNIITTTYTDRKYDPAKPYYYLVMAAKNGRATFVSYVIDSTGENVVISGDYRILSVSFVTENAEPCLAIDGRYADGITITAKVADTEAQMIYLNGYFKALYPLSGLTENKKWYDIRLGINAGKYHDIDLTETSMNINQTFSYDGRTYHFASWSDKLKIYFETT